MVGGVIATYSAIANSEYLEVLARETEHWVLTSMHHCIRNLAIVFPHNPCQRILAEFMEIIPVDFAPSPVIQRYLNLDRTTEGFAFEL